MGFYGLGRFGDRRLEEGGSSCTVSWFVLAVGERGFVGLAATGQASFASAAFCTILV